MSVTSTAQPRVTRTVIVVVVLALVAGAVVVLGKQFLDVVTCYDPPSQQQRSEQEAFLASHLPDARKNGWTVADCDDEGQVSLNFTTRLAGVVVTRTFLSDPACHTLTNADPSELSVQCRSGDLDVFIFLEDRGAADTQGQLAWTPE